MRRCSDTEAVVMESKSGAHLAALRRKGRVVRRGDPTTKFAAMGEAVRWWKSLTGDIDISPELLGEYRNAVCRKWNEAR